MAVVQGVALRWGIISLSKRTSRKAVVQGVALRWWIKSLSGKTPRKVSLLFTLLSLLYQLYSISCPLSSSCQLELDGHAEVLGGGGVGRRGEEGFVELAVVVGREGDEL